MTLTDAAPHTTPVQSFPSRASAARFSRLPLPALLIAPLLVVAALAIGRQWLASAAAPTEVGVGSPGQNAVEFVGRVDQDGSNFKSYGYVTHVAGLTDAQLFSGTIPFVTEANARLTFYSTATLTSRYVISGVFTIDSLGTTIYYYSPSGSGATFDSPGSFITGTPIATDTVRSQDILIVQAPNLGLATNTAETHQTGVQPFVLGAQTYQLGQVDLLERSFWTGEATRTDAITPKSFTAMSGNAFATGVPGQFSFLPILYRP